MHPAPAPPHAPPQGTPGALIHVDHLSRVIGAGARRTVIVDDVTFSVPAQSLFAINGPSGSGKSTILNMLTGIDRPTSGRVLFAGQELRAFPSRLRVSSAAPWLAKRPAFFVVTPPIAKTGSRERWTIPSRTEIGSTGSSGFVGLGANGPAAR